MAQPRYDNWREMLLLVGACSPMVGRGAEFGDSIADGWAKLQRGDQLIWYLAKLGFERKAVLLCVCEEIEKHPELPGAIGGFADATSWCKGTIPTHNVPAEMPVIRTLIDDLNRLFRKTVLAAEQSSSGSAAVVGLAVRAAALLGDGRDAFLADLADSCRRTFAFADVERAAKKLLEG